MQQDNIRIKFHRIMWMYVQKHYATSQKVAGSNPDEVIGFFNSFQPHTMALGSTQPLTEMSTRNFPGG
jgi:hypothetical protein